MDTIDYASIPYLEGMRDYVEDKALKRQNVISLIGETYQSSKEEVMVMDYEDWKIGYKVENFGVYIIRKVFLAFGGRFWSQISKEEKDPRMLAIFQVFFKHDSKSEPELEIINGGKEIAWTQPDIPMPVLERALN